MSGAAAEHDPSNLAHVANTSPVCCVHVSQAVRHAKPCQRCLVERGKLCVLFKGKMPAAMLAQREEGMLVHAAMSVMSTTKYT